MVISGLLMGLNAIDYNVLIRGEEFDRSVRVQPLFQLNRAACMELMLRQNFWVE